MAHLMSQPSEPESPIEIPSPIPPTVKQPVVSAVKISPATIQKSVVAKINGVSLKNGPGPKFPEIGRLKKGDSLPLIRSTTIKFNGKPWLMVDADGRKAYVWSELVAMD
jgi:uncharacterized protein YraI